MSTLLTIDIVNPYMIQDGNMTQDAYDTSTTLIVYYTCYDMHDD